MKKKLTMAAAEALKQAHPVNCGHAVMDYVAFVPSPRDRSRGRIYAYTISHGEGDGEQPWDWACCRGTYGDSNDVSEAARRGAGEGVARVRRKIADMAMA